MKQYILPPIISLVSIIAITHDHFIDAIFNFLIAGAIPGTAISLPFWVMITIYCLAITTIVTIYLESTLTTHRAAKALHQRKQQLPRRRYSSI